MLYPSLAFHAHSLTPYLIIQGLSVNEVYILIA
jgi:hypothetical protein